MDKPYSKLAVEKIISRVRKVFEKENPYEKMRGSYEKH